MPFRGYDRHHNEVEVYNGFVVFACALCTGSYRVGGRTYVGSLVTCYFTMGFLDGICHLHQFCLLQCIILLYFYQLSMHMCLECGILFEPRGDASKCWSMTSPWSLDVRSTFRLNFLAAKYYHTGTRTYRYRYRHYRLSILYRYHNNTYGGV